MSILPKSLPYLLLSLLVAHASGQSAHATEPFELSLTSTEDPFDIPLEDLFNVEVTSVSKKSEKVMDAASAIYVLTDEDIHRLGVTTIAEALRTVPGLHVARVNSNNWAISSRGFTDQFANKLLVMIDGRTVYTPIFSGTYWEVQDVNLADIERIEIIRGPGATVWGANAVNGVINIITKTAKYTQGHYIQTGYGNYEQGFIEGRSGFKIHDNFHYRVYGKFNERDHSKHLDGTDTLDAWRKAQTGFRADWENGVDTSISVQGSLYRSAADSSLTDLATGNISEDTNRNFGGHVLASWNKAISNQSSVTLQGYYDNASRLSNFTKVQIHTLDTEFQHNWTPDNRNNLIWGVGFRSIFDTFANTESITYPDNEVTSYLYSAFLQHKYSVVPDKLFLTLGSKIEYNSYTGGEIQPSARFLWKASKKHNIWGSISRAVRTPSRAEDGIIINGNRFEANSFGPGTPSGFIQTRGSDNYDSEQLISYELGYRSQIHPKLSVDIASFYNNYNKIGTLMQGTPFLQLSALGTPQLVIPVTGVNLGEGNTYGFEVFSNWQVLPNWRLHASYSLIKTDIHAPAGNSFVQDYDHSTPSNMVSIRSYLSLPYNLEFDTTLRYNDNIPQSNVDSTIGLDLRLGWAVHDTIELNLVGQNILDDRNVEFIDSITSSARELPRSVFGTITWKF